MVLHASAYFLHGNEIYVSEGQVLWDELEFDEHTSEEIG